LLENVACVDMRMMCLRVPGFFRSLTPSCRDCCSRAEKEKCRSQCSGSFICLLENVPCVEIRMMRLRVPGFFRSLTPSCRDCCSRAEKEKCRSQCWGGGLVRGPRLLLSSGKRKMSLETENVANVGCSSGRGVRALPRLMSLLSSMKMVACCG
jgi:hypothetical protein